MLHDVTPVFSLGCFLFRQYLPVFRKTSAFRRKNAGSGCESPQDQHVPVRCEKGEWEEIKNMLSRIESHITRQNEYLAREEDDMNDTLRKNKKSSDRESRPDQCLSVRCKKGEWELLIDALLRIESHIVRENEELKREVDKMNDMIRKYEKRSDRESPQDQYLSGRFTEGEWEQIDDILSRIESLLVRENEELDREMNDMIKKCEKCSDRESPQDQYLSARCTKGERQQIVDIFSRMESRLDREDEMVDWFVEKARDMRRKYKKCT
jgi:hypothetical protein